MEVKTPYELRLEMVKLAKDYLERQYEIATASYMTMIRETQSMGNQITREMLDMAPKIYDTSAIMDLAEKFNGFVSMFPKKK